ncbi:MlaD family protein [Nocardia niwae]|uniref:MlaD family protein n=1 Tax=Nocardia niwae TaxID=626084 RepID=A0ABV2XGY6_9NOCA
MKRIVLIARQIGAPALAASIVLLATTGCGFRPGDVPVPGTGVSGPTYQLRIEFADVLNLPQGAKVIAGGVRVGQLIKVTLVDPVAATPDRPAHRGYVVADLALRSSVRLRVGTTAELRQETPLGDVHISLTEPDIETGGELEPGATIRLANTTQSPPIEDILAGLSTFIGSGAVADIQSIVRDMNGVLPADPRDTARVAGLLGSDLLDLGDHLESVDAVLDGLRATVEEGLGHNLSTVGELLNPYGVRQTSESINAQIGVIFVLTALGPLAPSAQWLGPLLQSLDGTMRAVVPMLFGGRPLDTESPSNLKRLVDLLHNKIIPFAEHGPKVNLVDVSIAPASAATALSPDEQSGRIVDTLRMIGAVR